MPRVGCEPRGTTIASTLLQEGRRKPMRIRGMNLQLPLLILAPLLAAVALASTAGAFDFGFPLPGGGSGAPTFGDPLRGLTTEELARFDAGREAFEEVETVEDGLGPVFNGSSCVGCHDVGATGGGSTIVERRFGTTTDGVFDPLEALGGSLIQRAGIGPAGACTFVGEQVPPEATIVAGRRTTPLFGLGLVDAVPDAAFLALARAQKFFQPSTAGRANIVTDV